MRSYVFLLLLLTLYQSEGRIAGDSCESDSSCLPWLSCVNNVCTQCGKLHTYCDNTTWPCCKGTKCFQYPGNPSICTQKCSRDSQCPYTQGCLKDEGVCVDCVRVGQKCDPITRWPCCSGSCQNNTCTIMSVERSFGYAAYRAIHRPKPTCLLRSCQTSDDCCHNAVCTGVNFQRVCTEACSSDSDCSDGRLCFKSMGACSDCLATGQNCINESGFNKPCCTGRCQPLSSQTTMGKCVA